jgi:nucleoside-diphosphate-sugar epimerase
MKLEHIYGLKDQKHKFVPFIIDKMLKNESIDLTHGTQKRDFIFVDDVIEAYVKIINCNFVENTFYEFEIGSGRTTSIRDFVKLARRLCASKSTLNFGALPLSCNEIVESKADISMMNKFGWEPIISLEDGLSRIIEFELNSQSHP